MAAKAYSYIRWSSKAQTEGDSLRRQLRSSRTWAAARGVELDETLRDEGVSSFRGHNRTRGHLGKFIAQVDEGRVAPGSFLLIDEFSRLGREDEVQMMHTLTDLILKGITIVTMNDEREYGRDSATEERLMGALMAISVSHRSAKRQGAMIRAAHEESKRRARDEGRKWHAAGPSWLRAIVQGAGSSRVIEFEEIPDRVAVVRRIYDMIEAGMGTSAIAVRFNTEEPPVPPFKHAAKGWQHAAVLGIAKSRTTLGEYQPHISTMGGARAGRSPDGPPIPGYYPAIVDEEQWFRVQAIIEGRRHGSRRGNNARAVTNLFQGICRCGVCGGTVGLHSSENTWAKSVLRCVDAGRGLCTNKSRQPYPAFERLIIANVRRVDLSAPQEEKVDAAKLQLQAAVGRRAELKKAIEALIDQIESGNRHVAERLDVRTAELEGLELQIGKLASSVEGPRAATPQQQQDALAALVVDLDTLSGADLYDRRLALSLALKGIISEIRFYPDRRFTVTVIDNHGIYDFRTPDSGQFWSSIPSLNEIHKDVKFMELFRRHGVMASFDDV